MIKTFSILLFTTLSAYAQFQPNSIGVVYLSNETSEFYQLTIAFPIQTLEKYAFNQSGNFQNTIDTLHSTGEITFFDKSGTLLTIKQKTDFKIQFWCENDGGTQYRPTYDVSIEKVKFKRKIHGLNEIQNIACFAIVNRSTLKVEHPDYKVSDDIKLEGDYNNDGQADCFLWTYYDDAENCDGKPLNHLGINLQVGRKHFGLRCCGP